MNIRDKDILLALRSQSYPGQRELAEACGCSLGAANISVQRLKQTGLIDEHLHITEKALALFQDCAPRQAILLAAGPGMHQSPVNAQLPHALMEVRGQRVIDRLICQLQEVGIRRIFVVVGFAKERFEYLIDQYGVELIVNSEYYEKSNLHSLALAADHLENSYIVPCDLWCRENPFRQMELYSWYMVGTEQTKDSFLRINRMRELVLVPADVSGNRLLGITYLLAQDVPPIRGRLLVMDADRRCKGAFWEEILHEGSKFCITSRLADCSDVVELHELSQLWELNARSADIAAGHICRLMKLEPARIHSLEMMKQGMTNTTFRFCCDGALYCIRIPTGKPDNLVDHRREADVYRLLAGRRLADEALFCDTDTGVKLSEWLSDVHPCDPANSKDVSASMALLRRFHDSDLQTRYSFDLFQAISFYEDAWAGADSLYIDYEITKRQVFSLRAYIDAQEKRSCLTHIDAVPENFLIHDVSGEVRLIDWEYAAMQDPHLDIAMFCLQALYDRQQVDATIDAYFPEGCSKALRLKIYCYIAAGGLLWSNWCEYEMRHGAEFGAYSLRQYRYAKEYYRIIQEELTK